MPRPRLADERGQSLIEFALLGPILVILLLGLVEFGRAIDSTHSLTTLSREAANLAARGTPLDTVADLVMSGGSDIGLPTFGGVIVSDVRVDTGAVTVHAQVARGGYAGRSRLGEVGERAPLLETLGLVDGQTRYLVELFFRHAHVTPLRNLLGFGVPDTLYTRAMF